MKEFILCFSSSLALMLDGLHFYFSNMESNPSLSLAPCNLILDNFPIPKEETSSVPNLRFFIITYFEVKPARMPPHLLAQMSRLNQLTFLYRLLISLPRSLIGLPVYLADVPKSLHLP